MGERRFVHELSRDRAVASGDEELRRLVDHRDRVVALLRASRREMPVEAGAYRSSYAARLWALAEAADAAEEPDALAPDRAHSLPHLELVEPASGSS
jgi:hypothetical protein